MMPEGKLWEIREENQSQHNQSCGSGTFSESSEPQGNRTRRPALPGTVWTVQADGGWGSFGALDALKEAAGTLSSMRKQPRAPGDSSKEVG